MITGTSLRARSERRNSRPFPSGRTRSRMTRSASCTRARASRSEAAWEISKPSRRSAKARLSRMAGSSSTRRMAAMAPVLRRRPERRGRLLRGLLQLGYGLVVGALGHRQRELVVARLDDAQARRGAERLPQGVDARMLHQEPLARAGAGHEVCQRGSRRGGPRDLPDGVARVERLAAPVHLVGADGLVGRALVEVLPEEIALRPVRREPAPMEPAAEDG